MEILMSIYEEDFWNRVAFSDGCWEWLGSYAPDGRAVYTDPQFGGTRNASRLSYIYYHKKDIGKSHILHNCLNYMWCVKPSCLYEGTQSDNTKDRYRDGWDQKGSKHGRAILTEEDVIEIRLAYKTGIYQTTLAKKYNVSQQVISSVVLRKTWSHVK